MLSMQLGKGSCSEENHVAKNKVNIAFDWCIFINFINSKSEQKANKSGFQSYTKSKTMKFIWQKE